MNDILRYLLLSTLIWGILVLAYPMISRAGSLDQRRWYLIATLLAGALVPLVHWASPDLPAIVVTIPEVSALATGQLAPDRITWSWTDLVLSLYLAGVLLRSGSFAVGMIQLVRLCQQGTRVTYLNTQVYLLPYAVVPFHGLGQLYFPSQMMDDPKAFQMAFRHEQAHQQLGHGIDLVLANLFRILFWFQPLVPLIIRELRLVHEFQADKTVIHQIERDAYARFIGSFRSTQRLHPTIHSLDQSPLKQRIMQMYTSPKTWKLSHFTILLALVSIVLGSTAFKGFTWTQHAGQASLAMLDSIPPSDQLPGSGDESFSVVEVMPRFPGCEDQGLTGVELDRCAQRKMLEYVYTHLKYPEEAIKNEVEGTSIASFVVEKNGTISNIKIVRDIGGGTGEETARVLRQMQEDGIRWIPGEQGGQTVRVEFKLPIKFKLTDDSETSTKKKKKH
ncbi:MAG: M56 family metallopeptidase [Saprospiraceae bacterium]